MKKVMVSIVIGFAALSVEAAPQGYMESLYADTWYFDSSYSIVEPQRSYMDVVYEGTIYSTANSLEPEINGADKVAENEVNGYWM